MDDSAPLYLGFDLSTQQLKAVAVTSDLKVAATAVFDFDRDARGFDIQKGVMTNEAEHEVFAPVAMWLQAVDSVLAQLKTTGLDFGRIKGISGAGMQHGSIYFSQHATQRMNELDENKTLQEQLIDAFAYPYSPNWQDASTQIQCDLFDKALGDEETLAKITGSKAHHRFTGPQILRFRSKHPDAYAKTSRISLVSSFLASIFLGQVAPIDISDACGMNLWDIQAGKYHEGLLALTAGDDPTKISDLKFKLGNVPESGSDAFGKVSSYFVRRYGFNPESDIIPFTGDNPSTILALPLRPLDAMVSLGTSTTFLMSTPYYKPDPSVHFMNHPTTPGIYMFMLCYKNGGLAREQVRDSLPPLPDSSNDPWSQFNHLATTHPPLNAASPSEPLKLALYFPRPEIVPNVSAGTYRYTLSPHSSDPFPLSPSQAPMYPGWDLPDDDARAILESQLLSLRLRSRNIVAPPEPNPDGLPAQPRRIYLVGGGSYNPAIAKLAGEVLGGVEGVYRLDVGGNACALGSAYKAAWACERTSNETFEEYVAKRWREEDFAQKVSDGYDADVYNRYEDGVQGLQMVEMDVLEREGRVKEVGRA